MIDNKKSEFLKQLIKFGLVGIVNTLLTLTVFFILTKIFGMAPDLANPIGFVFGFTNSFVMNKIWTFKSKGDVRREGFWFIIVALAAYGIQFVIFKAIDVLFSLPLFNFLFTIPVLDKLLNKSHDWAMIISMGFYTIIGFFGNRFITFMNKK